MKNIFISLHSNPKPFQTKETYGYIEEFINKNTLLKLAPRKNNLSELITLIHQEINTHRIYDDKSKIVQCQILLHDSIISTSFFSQPITSNLTYTGLSAQDISLAISGLDFSKCICKALAVLGTHFRL